jgi:hypothetical protein
MKLRPFEKITFFVPDPLGEGKYRVDRLHRRPGGVTGYSKETLKKITKTHFSMTEVHAATARGCLTQGDVAPAACKLACLGIFTMVSASVIFVN